MVFLSRVEQLRSQGDLLFADTGFREFYFAKTALQKERQRNHRFRHYEENGIFYRFLKSEANPATIILEKGSTLTGDDYARVASFDKEMAKLQQGVYEAPTAFRLSNGKWCLMLDFYGVEGEGQGYVPFISDTLESGRFIRSEERFSFSLMASSMGLCCR